MDVCVIPYLLGRTFEFDIRLSKKLKCFEHKRYIPYSKKTMIGTELFFLSDHLF